MNKSEAPPPSYDQISNPNSSTTDNSNRQIWYRKFIGLNFTSDEANQYAELFATNEIEISMISELSDAVLRTIGIEKAGHRIRILRLQNKPPAPAPRQAQNITAPSLATPRCYKHSNIGANEKCYKCKRLVCLICRREKRGDLGLRYYCEECYDECTIL